MENPEITQTAPDLSGGQGGEPQPEAPQAGEIKTAGAKLEFIVNTWPTKSIPWIIDREVEEETLAKVLEFLKKTKVPNRLPPLYSLPTSCPRYYKITVHDDGIDIIGWKYWKNMPTKWGIKNGYWHETCQEELIEALESTMKN